MRTLILMFMVSILSGGPVASPAVKSLAEAESQCLDAYDEQKDLTQIDLPSVKAEDQPALQWLLEAAQKTIPANPFPKKGLAWGEAEQLIELVSAPTERWPSLLERQTLNHSGTRLALWRWGQRLTRSGRLSRPLRHRWEDKLLTGHGPELLEDYVRRHALCFALAEADETRFSDLKRRLADRAPDLFVQFQRAFALLGSPSPLFHLWLLPEMQSIDVSFSQMHTRQIWVAPDPGLIFPNLSPTTVWIVPTTQGSQPDFDPDLIEQERKEAEPLAARLKAAGRTAYLAPSRKSLETYALVYFPIRIELADDGWIRSICMGDAVLEGK